ncbi:MAG: gliding motility-associated C-terminal domain-containing protein, partial [Bacteroidota bacterium]
HDVRRKHPDSSIVYSIVVTNVESGCVSEITMQVRELTSCPEDLIYAPNIFSPNGDGFNDDFRVLSTNIMEIDFLRVFDRWGALVWESSDINEGWDGTYRGQPAGPGVYIYSLEAPCILDDTTIRKMGDVTIVR